MFPIVRLIFTPIIRIHKPFFSIDPVTMMEGALPERQRRLVMAWAEIHQFELLTDWDLLQDGKAPVKIEPLR
jgi:hypothetical protein